MNFRPKNLLIVTHHYPPHVTGVGFAAQQQAQGLAALGHSVTVVTSRTSPEEKDTSADGVNVIRIPALNFTEKWGVPFPIFSPSLLWVLFRETKEADVVHIHDAFYISSFCAAVVAWLRGKPLALTQHVAMVAHPNPCVIAIEKLVYRTTGALIFRLSRIIFTYNKRVEDFLRSRRVDPKKLAVMINGVDIDLFHPASAVEKESIRRDLGLDPRKKVILFVGRFVPKKGFDKVLAVRNPEYTIVCAGGEPPRKVVEGVMFLGKLDRPSLVRAYQAADIFLLPSEGEGFPLSIQEAMASGVPIISKDDAGYDIYNIDKEKAYFLTDVSEGTLRRVVADTFADESTLREMSRYSREYAEQNFRWPQIIAELNAQYDRIIGPKRIAIVSDAVYPFNTGGKEKRIHELTSRLAAQGHEVTIYCMHWWGGGKTFVQDGITFQAISGYHELYAGTRRSITEAVFFALGCLRLLFRKFDVVDVDHMPQMVIFTMKIVCVLKRKPLIVTWHEVWGREYWKEYLGPVGGEIGYLIEKVSAHLPDLIISVSEYTARRLKDLLGVKKEIVVVSNGVNIGLISQKLAPEVPADIMFAGRLLANKNVDLLVRAVAIVKKKIPGIRARILGEGPEKEKLVELTRSLGLEQNISFVGFLADNTRVYGLMKSSKVFVFPSTREGFGIVVLEANAAGLPVITINHEHNAARELITKGENGMLVNLDEAEIATAIEKLLTERKAPEFYRSYVEKYDWDSIVKGVEAIYFK